GGPAPGSTGGPSRGPAASGQRAIRLGRPAVLWATARPHPHGGRMSEHPRHTLTRPVCIAATPALTLTAAAAPAAADPAGGQPPAATITAFDTGEQPSDPALPAIDPQARVHTETGGLGLQISGMRMSPDGARIALRGFSGT